VGLFASGGQELLELLQATDQRVAFARQRGNLALAEGIPLILLGDPRLELRLALVEVLQLGLKTGDTLLGRHVTDEQHVQNEQEKDRARGDEEPGDPCVRAIGHGLGF
jgi:hypothetical protein